MADVISRCWLLLVVLLSQWHIPLGVFAASCFSPSEPFPAPKLNPDADAIRMIGSRLEGKIQKAITSGNVSWNSSITSFAIEVTSAHDTLWQSYRTAPILGEYPDSETIEVDGTKAFRIASISKVFTVLAILLQQQDGKLSIKDSIVKHIPELVEGNNTDGIAWQAITLESMASQLSGIRREYGQGDMSDPLVQKTWYGGIDAVDIGLPPLEDEASPTCGTNHVTSKTCSMKDIIEGSKTQNAVFPPNFKSTYSNVAFILLGAVLERVTGKTYQEVLDSLILQPLDMRRTTVEKPEDSEGVIPAMMNDWYYIAGAYDPTGGIYSTSSDLSKFLRALLNSELLDEATTNAWFKPRSWSSSLSVFYGMPWEIFRSTTLLKDTDRGITLITKAGGLFAYVSHIVLVPEFALAFTILVAGDSQALMWLDNEVISTFLHGIEEISRKQVNARYSGTYKSATLNSSVELEVDGSSGLVVRSWISNGTDFLPEYTRLETGKRDTSRSRVQLLPAKTHRKDQVELWRATVVLADLESKGIIDVCGINDVDSFMYGEKSIAEFEFILDENGEAKEVRLPAFRITLQKMQAAALSSPSSEVWPALQKVFHEPRKLI